MRVLKTLVPALFLISVFAFNSNAQENNKEGDVYFIVDEMPEFPGGDKALRTYIANRVSYPEIAKKNGIQGKVYVSFVVDAEGSVTSTRIERGVDPSLDKESLRVVSELPKWKPGKEKGKAVKVKFTVPINFALNEEDNRHMQKEDGTDTQVFRIVEDMPEFPGGKQALMKFIAQNVNYPEVAQKDSIQGKVFVSFVVEKNGNVSNTRIARGVHPSLDKEALRVISEMPQWKPGKQRGKAVNVEFTLPIKFALK